MASNKCAACKFLGGLCMPDCVFAPHFPSTNPQKFESVNKIFGAVNVYKILSNLRPSQREKAATSLCYEAEARKNDPIHGFVSILDDKENDLKNLNIEIEAAQNELAAISGPDEVPPYIDVPMPDYFFNLALTRAQNMNDGDGSSGASTYHGPFTSNQDKNRP